jgi:hypothetical protein
MSHDRRADDAETAALLGALADAAAMSPQERTRGERLLDTSNDTSNDAMAQLASHRALLTELRALPGRAPSPDWRALEVSIRQACAEVPVPRKLWSWPTLRWPTLGVSATAAAVLAFAMWTRAPGGLDGSSATPHNDVASTPTSPEIPVAPQPTVVQLAPSGFLLDDELISTDPAVELGVSDLLEQLPSTDAITLGAIEAEPEDLDELLPRETFDHEIDQLDNDALRALDQWLDAPEQKG